jgi:putative tricarboxylic transport membrane protein
MIGRDGVTGLVACAASLVLFWLTLGLEKNPLVPIGPGFYPRLVLGITAALGLALLVADLLRQRLRPREARAAQAERLNYALVALTFAAFGVLEPPRRPGLWLRGGALALATTIVTYYVFEDYLAVLLPRGSWTGF